MVVRAEETLVIPRVFPGVNMVLGRACRQRAPGQQSAGEDSETGELRRLRRRGRGFLARRGDR